MLHARDARFLPRLDIDTIPARDVKFPPRSDIQMFPVRDARFPPRLDLEILPVRRCKDARFPPKWDINVTCMECQVPTKIGYRDATHEEDYISKCYV